jgi:hypothetical protein
MGIGCIIRNLTVKSSVLPGARWAKIGWRSVALDKYTHLKVPFDSHLQIMVSGTENCECAKTGDINTNRDFGWGFGSSSVAKISSTSCRIVNGTRFYIVLSTSGHPPSISFT